jgi:hypothetical protein
MRFPEGLREAEQRVGIVFPFRAARSAARLMTLLRAVDPPQDAPGRSPVNRWPLRPNCGAAFRGAYAIRDAKTAVKPLLLHGTDLRRSAAADDA